MTFFAHGGISIFFARYVCMIDETLRHKFHPYSILTGQTMDGFVIYCVLKQESAYFHSIATRFDAEVAEKFLNGIYYVSTTVVPLFPGS